MTTPVTSSTTTAANTLISSQGIGSGLDIGSIVSSLTTAAGLAQTNALNDRKTALTTQVSAFGTFSSALATLQATLTTLQDPTKLAGRTATLADTTIATATATSSAVPAQYSLQVQNLATAASLSSNPVASGTAVIGTGTLKISVGGASASITIDSSDNTLQGIVAAINSATGNPGVSASILTTTAGARLVLSGSTTGAANAITVTQSGGDGGLASLVYDPANNIRNLTQTQAALDANFSLNGFAATSASNVVSTAVTGVTLTLVKPTAANTPTTLTIGNDNTAAQTSIGTFVSALNGVLTSIQSLTSYDPSTGTAGALLGNATIEAFKGQLSKILGQVNTGIASGPQTITALGITANTQGTYDTNSTTLSNALSSSLSSIGQLLGGKTGIATQLNSLVAQYTQAGGLLDTINQGLKSGLTDVAKQQTALKARMAVYSATLTQEYNAMDTAVALLKQTQTYLTAQFNAGSTSSNNSTSTSSGLGSGTLSTTG
ncbi:MAG TPA: flagellar filament capping protein FliD [Steroidobacteraceae bacterium]